MVAKRLGFLPVLLVGLLLVLFLFPSNTTAQDSSLSFTDKTLVAWVFPRTLKQRGGGVLSLEYPRGTFDALVFGEVKDARWMAGSNGLARTQQDQEDYLAETVSYHDLAWRRKSLDVDEMIQMAVVYEGKQVTIYRDGEIYAQYNMTSAPVTFTRDTLILLGRRHVDADDMCLFYGTIDDARIYAHALDAKTILSLKPNVRTGPEPLAWWSFEDGCAEDHMNTFGGSVLVGRARVVDGRLRLDGETSYMIAGAMLPKMAMTADLWSFDERDKVVTRGIPKTAMTADLWTFTQINLNLRTYREIMLLDRYRPGYHLVCPEGVNRPFDANGAIFWKGRYHLFYIYNNGTDFDNDWGHVSSVDLVHWRQHPTGLKSGMFSGNCFLNKEGVPTMCYHQQFLGGNSLAVALDDQLNNWKKLDSNPITPKTKPGDEHHGKYASWDPYGWLEGDTYYAVFGGRRPAIVKSESMAGPWNYVGDLFAHGVEGISLGEDVSCPDFFKIGNKHMLLCISHHRGAYYYLGEWQNEQLHPELFGQMSWVDNSFFAPRSLLDDKGRRIMWAWLLDLPGIKAWAPSGWSGTMSLPRVLSLGEDGTLRMRPPCEFNRLRYNAREQSNLTLATDSQVPLKDVRGDSMELMIEMTLDSAQQCGVEVCASADGSEKTLVFYDAAEKKLKVDTRKSSLEHGPKVVEAAPFVLRDGEVLTLRIYVDKSVIEVFANDRQAIARRIYPTHQDSVNVSLFSNGGSTRVPIMRAWDMMPSNAY